MRHYVFVTLSSSGWGETAFALRIAKQLQQRGDRVFFFARAAVAPLLKGAVPFEVVDPFGAFMTFVIGDHVARNRAAAIILADYFTCAQFLAGWDLAPDFLLEANVPLVAIDTWDTTTTGFDLDMFRSTTYKIPHWISQISRRILPVPFIPANGKPGTCNALPPSPRKPTARRKLRQRMGIPAHQKILLFCTAGWQYPAVVHPDGRRIAAAVPRLLAHYLSVLDHSIQVFHVGPVQFKEWQALGPRYHWMPQVTPTRFRAILRSADLMVSLNVSATTLVSSVAGGVPCVLLSNSFWATSVEEALSQTRTSSPEVMGAWLDEVLPLYPFYLWPLGFHRFLSPLLDTNPYRRTMEMIELLDEERFVGTCTGLLSCSSAREDHLHRQTSYVGCIKNLPSPNEVLDALLEV